jgi:hypothetical protein
MSKCYEAFDRESIENSVFKGNFVANGGYFLVNGYLRSVGTGRDLSLKRLFTIHRDTVTIHRDTVTIHRDTVTIHRDTVTIHRDTFAIHKDRSRPVPTKSFVPLPHPGLIVLSIHPRN